MFLQLLTAVIIFQVGFSVSDDPEIGFVYDGFRSANLSIDGIAELTSNGLLKLTNRTMQQSGHAFYPGPITFKKSSNGSAFSFSTTFVFAIVAESKRVSGDGMAFVIAPQKGFPGAKEFLYLGIFNETNMGNASNHVFAVELHTVQMPVFSDTNDNHVGIDINSLRSEKSAFAGYYDNTDSLFRNLTLISGLPMQVWIEYNGVSKEIEVTLAPFEADKPKTPLLKLSHDLSPILRQTMFAGFSASAGPMLTTHYVLGWSFKVNGVAQKLSLSRLPKLPRDGPKKMSKWLTIGWPLIFIFSSLAAISGVAYYVRRMQKFAEVLEDWEVAYGPHRFKYKDLYLATKGFKETELLGAGGFGRVYRGTLPTSKTEVAVKRVSHDSKQGMREFIAEIVSIGRLRHRNLVSLLGYCRRKGELLLVYECMANGSLDKFLYDQPKFTLNWGQRFGIMKGVASGLFYLHEGWEQVVIHRDVKASNVLLDGELNGRLGDFGLARLHDHGSNPQTTRLVGTFGYLAPEHARSGRFSTSTDVYAFGVFLLEVVCGRRPIEPRASIEEPILIDWVFFCRSEGKILEAVDQNLGDEYLKEEAELVLNLGLLCSHQDPAARPSMGQVLQYLEKSLPMPDLSSVGGCSAKGLTFFHRHGSDDFAMSTYSFPSSSAKVSSQSSHIPESLLSTGC